MLTVVDTQVAPLERKRRAAQPGPALEQHDPAAGIGQSKRGRDSGQAATGDDDQAVSAVSAVSAVG